MHRQSLVIGTGAVADAVATGLAAQGWSVRRHGSAAGADLSGDEELLVFVAPESAADPASAFENICLAPARLVEAMAARLPPPVSDETGELRASGQAVFILAQTALVPGLGPDGSYGAQDALLGWLRGAALSLAPQMRLNAVACTPAAPAALTQLLAWLLSAHVVTGQVLSLGTQPRLETPWRGAAQRNPAGATD